MKRILACLRRYWLVFEMERWDERFWRNCKHFEIKEIANTREIVNPFNHWKFERDEESNRQVLARFTRQNFGEVVTTLTTKCCPWWSTELNASIRFLRGLVCSKISKKLQPCWSWEAWPWWSIEFSRQFSPSVVFQRTPYKSARSTSYTGCSCLERTFAASFTMLHSFLATLEYTLAPL